MNVTDAVAAKVLEYKEITMKSQIPAEGILKINDWGSARVYQVVCNCNNPDHSHNVWIETDSKWALGDTNTVMYENSDDK